MASLLRKSSGVRVLLNTRYAVESGKLDKPLNFVAVSTNPPSPRSGLLSLRPPPKLTFEDDKIRTMLLKKHPEFANAPFRRYVEARGFYEHPVDTWVREHKKLVAKGHTAQEAESILEKRLADRRYFAHVETDLHRRMALKRGKTIVTIDDHAGRVESDVARNERARLDQEKREDRAQLLRLLEDRVLMLHARALERKKRMAAHAAGAETDAALMNGDDGEPADAGAAADQATSFDYTDESLASSLTEVDGDGAGFVDVDSVMAEIESGELGEDGNDVMADLYLTREETSQFSRRELLQFVQENPRYERFFHPSLWIGDFRIDYRQQELLSGVDVDNEEELVRAAATYLRMNDPDVVDDEFLAPPASGGDSLARRQSAKQLEPVEHVIPEELFTDDDVRYISDQMGLDLDFFSRQLPFTKDLEALGLSDIESKSEQEIIDILQARKDAIQKQKK